MLTRLKVIGAKIETAEGTAVALAETDFFHAFDIEVNPVPEMLEQPYHSTTSDPYAQITGKKWYELKFKTFRKGSGAAGTAPPTGPLFQALGMTETPVASTSVTYAPSTTPLANFFSGGKSCTIKVYENGILHVLAGCRGTMRTIFEAGKPAIDEWTFWGLYTAVTDAEFPTNTPNTTAVAVVKSSTLTLQAYAAIAAKLEVDFANTVTPMDDTASANSIKGFMITDRKPVGSCDPQSVLVQTHDFYGKMMSGDVASSAIVVGATAGNICTQTMPKTQYGPITKGNRGGIMAFNTPLIFSRNAGDDWSSIVFT
jgi:hypothetical protein